MTIDSQTVVRTNCATLYSTAVFDLDARPVNYPAGPGKRFMSMLVLINMPETV